MLIFIKGVSKWNHHIQLYIVKIIFGEGLSQLAVYESVQHHEDTLSQQAVDLIKTFCQCIVDFICILRISCCIRNCSCNCISYNLSNFNCCFVMYIGALACSVPSPVRYSQARTYSTIIK